MKLSPVTKRILRLPPIKLRAALDKLHPDLRCKVANELCSLLQNVAWTQGYVESRADYGYGDQGHEQSVGVANKRLSRVRKVLGFNVAPADIKV